MGRTRRIIGILAAVVLLSAASSAGSAQLNVIYGTNGNDTIVATPAADVIYAKSGNDTITGVGTGDVVWASSGNDKVFLEGGTVSNVLIDTNVGHDTIESTGLVDGASVNAGSGNDVIKLSGWGIDVAGESGNDKYTNWETTPGAPNSASLGNGHDEVILYRASSIHLGNGNDFLQTSSPGDVNASSGNDRILFLCCGGDAPVFLGSGHDTVSLNSVYGVTLTGSNGNDRVSIVGGGGHVFHGQSGNDTTEISFFGANNSLFGGSGRDKARLDFLSSATTCNSIETVVDFAGHKRTCS